MPTPSSATLLPVGRPDLFTPPGNFPKSARLYCSATFKPTGGPKMALTHPYHLAANACTTVTLVAGLPKTVRGPKSCKQALKLAQIPLAARAYAISAGKPLNFSNIARIPCPPGYEPGASDVGTCKGEWPASLLCWQSQAPALLVLYVVCCASVGCSRCSVVVWRGVAAIVRGCSWLLGWAQAWRSPVQAWAQ